MFKVFVNRHAAVVCAALLVSALAGCNDDSNSSAAATSTSAPASTTTSAATGTTTSATPPAATGITTTPAAPVALSISGTPAKVVQVGTAYQFVPTVKLAVGVTTSFAVANPPAWITFDKSTGKLSGTPKATDVGVYPNISIKMTNGALTASLAPFTVTVASGSSALATLTWVAPTAAAGEPAAKVLAGYHVYYGTTQAGMTHVANINDPTATSYVIDNLTSGTWYFAIASFDEDQTESALSPTVAVSL